jgi:hypothetical protein
MGPFRESSGEDRLIVKGLAVRCADPECNRLTVKVTLGSGVQNTSGSLTRTSTFFDYQIYPLPAGKPFPDSVPALMLEDYQEAWAIIALSPKS